MYVLTDVLAATTVNQLEFSREIKVETIIDNPDGPFSNGNTQFMFVFRYLPEDESLYQNNGFDQVRNFAMDQKLATIGTGPVNGDNFGNDLQIIKSVEGTFISATQMKVTAIIETGVDADAIIQQGDKYRYKMTVITEDHALPDADSDKVNLLIDYQNEFFIQKIQTDLVKSAGIKFIEHPYSDIADGVDGTDLQPMPVDDLVAEIPLHIDFTSIDASEGVKIKQVESKLVLRDSNAIEQDIELESFSFSTENAQIVGGKAQNINFSQDTVFKIPDDEIRQKIRMFRDDTLDVGDDLYYIYRYPFMHRWEYWVALLGITTPPEDVFDAALPNDGLNQLWNRLANVTTWGVHYDVTLTVEQNGETAEQTFTAEIADSIDYEGNPDWTSQSIISIDQNTALPVESGGIKYVYGYEDIEIKAQSSKTTGAVPSSGNVVMAVWIETYEAGGVDDIRRITSLYPLSEKSWFKSVDGSGLTEVTKIGNTLIGRALLDHTKLPSNEKFTVYARIYPFFDGSFKQFEDNEGGNDFEFEDNAGGAGYQLEDNAGGGGPTLALGTVWKQDFVMIQENPIETPSSITEIQQQLPNKCCFQMPVFAEESFTNELFNDIRSEMFAWAQTFVSALITLEKFDGTWNHVADLNDDTLGTFYPFGFFITLYKENAIRYELDWSKVLDVHGAGNYRIKCVGTDINANDTERLSLDYCLKQYRADLIDGTVRFDYWNNGNIGNIDDDKKKKDFGTLNGS